MGRCILYTGIRLLLLIHHFIISLAFSSFCSSVRSFVCSYFRPVRGITSKFYMQATRVEYISPTIEKRCTWDNGLLWLRDRPCNIYVGQWPIFHGPLILPYIIVRLKLFLYIRKMAPAGDIRAPPGTCSSFFIFLSLQFSNIRMFCHTFLRNWGLEDWNLVHTWTVGRCILYTRIRLLLFIHPVISSFFFLSSFQTIKFFVTLFSGTVRPGSFKLHTWTVGRCNVYTRIRLLLLIRLFISSVFFLQFSFSPILRHQKFLLHFSQELGGL